MTIAGEHASAARGQVSTSLAAAHTVAAATSAGPSITYGVDLFEGNSWFADQTVSFMILKAFEPGYGQDHEFATRFPLVKSSGRLRGAYVFGHPSYSASLAASQFAQILRNNGFDAARDRVFLDHEVTDGKSPAYCASWAQEFCGQLKSDLGAVPGVYTFTNFISQGNCAGLGAYPLWFAYPETAGGVPPVSLGPWAKASLIQYAVTSIDWDFFPGGVAALTEFWHSGAVAQPQQPKPQEGPSMQITAYAPDVQPDTVPATAKSLVLAADPGFQGLTEVSVRVALHWPGGTAWHLETVSLTPAQPVASVACGGKDAVSLAIETPGGSAGYGWA